MDLGVLTTLCPGNVLLQVHVPTKGACYKPHPTPTPQTLSLLGTLTTLKGELDTHTGLGFYTFLHVYYQLVGLFGGPFFSLEVFFFRFIRKIGEGIGIPLQYCFP